MRIRGRQFSFSINDLLQEDLNRLLSYINNGMNGYVLSGTYEPQAFNINSDGLLVAFNKEIVVDTTKNYYVHNAENKSLVATLPLSESWVQERGILISAGINMNLRPGMTYDITLDDDAIKDLEDNEHTLGRGAQQISTLGTRFTYTLSASGGTNIAQGSALVLSANMPIFPGGGLTLITNTDTGTAQVIQANDSRVSFSGSDLTFEGSLFIEPGNYTIEVQENFLTIEFEGNQVSPWYGMSKDEWQVAVEAVPFSFSLSPQDNETAWNYFEEFFQISFSNEVSIVNGSEFLIFEAGSTTPVAVIPTSSPDFVLGPENRSVGFGTNELLPGTDYFVLTNGPALVDVAGNQFQLDDQTQWNFRTSGVRLMAEFSPANESTELNVQGMAVQVNFNLPVVPQPEKNLYINGTAIPFGDARLVWSQPDASGQAWSRLQINFAFEADATYAITTDETFALADTQVFEVNAGEFGFTTAEATPEPLENLPGMQLFGFDLVNDSFTPVGNVRLQYFDQDELVLPANSVNVSQLFERSDGLRIKVVMVGDYPATANDDVRVQQVEDADLANQFKAGSGKIIRYKMSGAKEGSDWRFPERVVISLNNDNQPAGVGFPAANPAYNSRPNYTPIYLRPGVMVGSGCMWIESYAEFPAKLANGLGPGTPDEFAVGINDFQFKRGLAEPIFPEPEKSPVLFNYVTEDADGDLAWQTRFYTYDGTNPASLTHRIYQKIDRTKVYLRCFIVLGYSGSQYNKGRGYVWNIDLNAASTADLIAQIDQLDASLLPAPNDSMAGVHLDEYLEQGPGNTEEDEILGVPQPNNYSKAYQSGSGRVEELAINNGGSLPDMNKLRHPYQQYFLFRNEEISTTAEAAEVSEREIFRMLLKQFKPRLSS